MSKFSILCFVLLLFLINTTSVRAQVVINEFQPNPNPEWVEFYNASGSAEYLKNYWFDDDLDFDDDAGSKPKIKLTGLIVNNVNFPFLEFSSVLNNTGDNVVLFDGSGNVVDSFQYTSSLGDGMTIGRVGDKNGEFKLLSYATKGSANAGPLPTSTPTLSPTDKPTATPHPTSTSKPTGTPILTVTNEIISPTPEEGGEGDVEGNTNNEGTTDVLGIRDELTPTGEGVRKDEQDGSTHKFPIAAVAFMLGGVFLIGAAVFPFLKNWKRKYNFTYGKKEGDEELDTD